MSRELNLSVPEASSGERLDRYLAAAQTDLSRSRLQAVIRAGHVWVNGRAARASLRLHGGDQVRVEIPERRSEAIEPEAIALDVVWEDEWLMVINKPPGLIVHPGAGIARGTLVHALLHHDPGIAGVGGEGRPGIVHRLDKDTSGLMVVAKAERSHRQLVEQIRERQVRRCYRALAWGDPRENGGRIETAIGRDPRDRKRMAVVRKGGKPAATQWTVRERFGLASDLDVRLETGRTHQIRVHLAHIRHPVVGDAVYGGGAKRLLSRVHSERSLGRTLLGLLPRQALHAAELHLTHPMTGEDLRLEVPVPEDYARAVDWLRALLDDHEGRGPR